MIKLGHTMKHLSLFLLLAVISCSHKNQIKNNHVVPGVCEKEFKKTKLSEGSNIWQKVAEAGGTTGSYLVTGLGYSTDLIVTFSSGIVGSVVVCSPLLALSTLSESGSHDIGSVTGECLMNVGTEIGKTLNPNLGPKAKKSTKSWQCPNVDSVAQGLMNVAECYSLKGDKDSEQLQLKRLHESSIFQLCLSKNVKDEIQEKLKLSY